MFPDNEAATDLLRQIGQGKRVGVQITMRGRNAARHRYYWKLLNVAADALSDKLPPSQVLDAETLHGEIKRMLGIGETITTPSGREIFKPRSTAFGKMSEPDFAAYLDRVVKLLSRWLQVEPAHLIDAAGERTAA